MVIRKSLTFSLMAAVALVISANPVVAGTLPTCRVQNPVRATSRSTLADGVASAASGDTLLVSGVCVGTTTVDKNLTIEGRGSPTGLAILKGPGTTRVLTIAAGKSVTIKSVVIRGGRATGTYPGNAGGGIRNNGRLTIVDSVIRKNQAAFGGGISSTNGLLLLRVVISDNVATGNGGGLDLDGANRASTATITRSTIHHNHAADGGGGINNYAGTLTIVDSRLHDNVAGLGGAISGSNIDRPNVGDVPSKIYLQGESELDHNHATFGAAVNAEGLISIEGKTVIRDHDMSDVAQGGVIEVFNYTSPLRTLLKMTENSLVTDNVGGPGGGAIVVWRDCGDQAPGLSGLQARTLDNTPGNVVTRTGTDGC